MTQDYYGIKRITAWPERKEFPFPPPARGSRLREGYAVKYEDGYVSWSPKEVFEKAYQPLTALSFGHAVQAMKEGCRVARSGWNGKGMWLSLVLKDGWTAVIITTPSDPDLKYLSWIGMKTADNKFVPWLASQTDILADDWQIVD